MKKWTIALALLVALIGGGLSYLWWGPPQLRLVLLGDITTAFASDVRDFVLENSGNLPKDWHEFELWQTKRDGMTRWKAGEIERRMQLLEPPYEIAHGVPQRILVTDPDIKGMQDSVNRWVDSAFIQLGITNCVANKAFEGNSSR